MTGIHWPAYLIVAVALVTSFVVVRRWYANDQQRSWIILLMLFGLVAISVLRSVTMGSFGPGFGLFVVFALFVLPALLTVGSSKVSGYEKLCWTLVSLFLSWLGFLVFMVVHGGRPAANRG